MTNGHIAHITLGWMTARVNGNCAEEWSVIDSNKMNGEERSKKYFKHVFGCSLDVTLNGMLESNRSVFHFFYFLFDEMNLQLSSCCLLSILYLNSFRSPIIVQRHVLATRYEAPAHTQKKKEAKYVNEVESDKFCIDENHARLVAVADNDQPYTLSHTHTHTSCLPNNRNV